MSLSIGDRVRFHTPEGDRFADVSGLEGPHPVLLVGLQPDASGRTHVMRRAVHRGTAPGEWSPR